MRAIDRVLTRRLRGADRQGSQLRSLVDRLLTQPKDVMEPTTETATMCATCAVTANERQVAAMGVLRESFEAWLNSFGNQNGIAERSALTGAFIDVFTAMVERVTGIVASGELRTLQHTMDWEAAVLKRLDAFDLSIHHLWSDLGRNKEVRGSNQTVLRTINQRLMAIEQRLDAMEAAQALDQQVARDLTSRLVELEAFVQEFDAAADEDAVEEPVIAQAGAPPTITIHVTMPPAIVSILPPATAPTPPPWIQTWVTSWYDGSTGARGSALLK